MRNTDWELEELPSGVSIGAGVRGMSRDVVREEGAQEMARAKTQRRDAIICPQIGRASCRERVSSPV